MSKRSLTIVANAIADGIVTAEVIDTDHVRDVLLVDTEYVISVQTKKDYDGSTKFQYLISKRYSQFRHLVQELKKTSTGSGTPYGKFVSILAKIIESETTAIFGKLNYQMVSKMDKNRMKVINESLAFMLSKPSVWKGTPGFQLLESFFLTDHVVEDGEDGEEEKSAAPPESAPETTKISPLSKKRRQSVVDRAKMEEQLKELGEEETLEVKTEGDQESPKSKKRSPKKAVVSSTHEHNLGAVAVVVGVVATAVLLRRLGHSPITLEKDIALLVCFACFCVGRASTFEKKVAAPTLDTSRRSALPKQGRMSIRGSLMARNLGNDELDAAVERAMHKPSVMIRKSLMAKPMLIPVSEDDVLSEMEDEDILDPLPKYHEEGDADCWSEPSAYSFSVRGPDYLIDKKKEKSGPYLLQIRGVDLFLTDHCPEKVGRNSKLFGGHFRDEPTVLFNFRLPWGTLLLYYEIPEKFIPFLKHKYENTPPTAPSMEGMSVAERTFCKFIIGTDDHRKETLKLIPVATEGPMIVKSVVAGKPAIIGNKLPVNYFYEPEDGKKKLFYEIDLDIAALSKARKALSLCRTYTEGLAVDLGFVIQGNYPDELPEQMLCGVRLHKIDLVNAPLLPPSSECFDEVNGGESD